LGWGVQTFEPGMHVHRNLVKTESKSVKAEKGRRSGRLDSVGPITRQVPE